MGKTLWKKYKKRYLCLVQVSQYTFVLCSYLEKKSEPRELMTLDNYTVDYADTDPELKAQGGRFFFNAVKEGDNVSFATDEEAERQLWIQALYRYANFSFLLLSLKLGYDLFKMLIVLEV